MKKGKTILILACLAAMVLVLSACGSGRSPAIAWPETGLAELLPEPPKPRGEITLNDDNSFSADIDASESGYEEYVEACVDHGFTVEAENSGSGYHAFNSDGYGLSLQYSSNSGYYTISLSKPVLEAGKTFNWPMIGPGTLLPEPSSHVGRIPLDSPTEFAVYIGEFSSEDYESYVDECIEAGFDVDYSRTDNSYTAEDANGDSLSITYEGFGVYYIHLTLPKGTKTEGTAAATEAVGEETDDAAETEGDAYASEGAASAEATELASAETADDSSLVDGMRPEFKEAMDTYELFYDQYVESMLAYEADPTDTTMMMQYFIMLDELTEMDRAFEAWEQNDMNSTELAYYAEVSARVAQKLAGIE